MTVEHSQEAKASDAPNPVEPVPVLAGTFAIYEDGKGGYVLVSETSERKLYRKHIPASLIRVMGPVLGKFGMGDTSALE